MAKRVINSFNAGELSPYLYARPDLDKYGSGCLAMENFVPLPYGGAIRRPAIEYIGASKNNEKIRIIPFKASTDSSYVLEFGTGYIRFYKDGERIEVLSVPVEIGSPYTDTDLLQVKVTQSVDVMWLTHPDYPIQRISRFSDTSWTIAQEEFDYPPLLEENDTEISITPSASEGSITLIASDDLFNIGHVGAYFAIGYERSSSDSWRGTVTGPNSFSPEVDVSGGFWSAGWEDVGPLIPTAFLQRNINGAGWLDVASGNSGTYESTVAEGANTLARLSVPGGVFDGFIAKETTSSVSDTVTENTTSPVLNVSYSNWSVNTGGSGWLGRVVIEISNDKSIWKSYVLLCDTTGIDSKNFSFATDSPEKASTYIRLKYTADNTSDFKYNIKADDVLSYGIAYVTSYTSATEVDADVISEFINVSPTTFWAEGAFSDYRGHPSAIALFESRLVYARTNTNPDTMWLSGIDEYSSFQLGSVDTSAMKLTLNSGKLDEIRWMVPQERLVIGTSGSEWSLGASDERKAITPTGFDLKRKTTYGSSDVQSILVNSAVLLLMRQGRKVREWTPAYNIQDYVAPDLTIFAEHITSGGIVQWDYQQQPDNILWGIRADGTLLGFTYERDQNVTGWHRHTLEDGSAEFESVAIIPRDNEEDEVWVSVKITVDSAVKRYIGRLNDREWGTDYTTDWEGADLYKTYSSPGTATLTGLDYLEGKTVCVVADGAILDNETVSSGSITIDSDAYSYVVVGLPFTSTLAPIYLEMSGQYGTTQGSKKDNRTGTVRFKDTFSAKVGQDVDRLDDVKFDQDLSPLYNGDAEVYFDNESDFLHTCYIVQEDPMPCTVLAMIPHMEGRR